MKERPYGGFAAYYDQVMDHTDYLGWHRHCLRIIRRYNINTQKIIDLGGGTGELAQFFSLGGYDIDILDISREMLKIARLKKYKKPPRFYCQDLRTIKLRSKYDLALCLNNTMNYLLTKNDLKKAFKSIANILKPGAFLIMDLCSVYHYKKEYDGQIFCRNFKNFSYIWAHNYNEKKSTAEIHISIQDYRSGRSVNEFHLNRLHNDDDIITAAERYFTSLAVLSGFTFKKRNAGSREIYFIFQKK